jgi:cell wall-associated NlpC family hydrolase
MTVARTLRRAIFAVTCGAGLAALVMPPAAASASSFPSTRSPHWSGSAPTSRHGRPGVRAHLRHQSPPSHDGQAKAAHSHPERTLHPVPAGSDWSGAGMAANGYWVVDQAGGVGAAGGAPDFGGLGPEVRLAGPVTGMAALPDGQGYWLASADGGVYAFGSAKFYGSVDSAHVRRLAGPVVGIAAARDGEGYWLVSSRGHVYSFGGARFFGPSVSLRSRIGVSPIVDIVTTPGGGGYWLVSSNGGVFCFGDATYHGSAAGSGRLIIGLAPTPDGKGYWLAGQHGSVMAFGDAPARGSAQGRSSSAPFVGIAAERRGLGYWFANSKGSTFGFGPAAATQARDLARAAVAIAADPAVVVPQAPVVASPGAPIKAASLGELDAQGNAAVAFALSQVGKPYVYGGTGPYGYDCSGLALASWLAAGVHLPRTAAEQYYAGTHVPLSQVEPGDLIFWASDPSDPSTIYHVAISLGGDRTVQATETGQTVQVLSLWGPGLVPLATQP